MTKTEILINYRQAIRQSEKLEELAKKLEKLSREKMGSMIGQLKSSWQSDNSPQYYNKAGKVQEEIKVTADSVKKIADSIRSTAEASKKAELQALEIAKSRIYR